jgi:hypothetical protein
LRKGGAVDAPQAHLLLRPALELAFSGGGGGGVAATLACGPAVAAERGHVDGAPLDHGALVGVAVGGARLHVHLLAELATSALIKAFAMRIGLAHSA